MPDPISFQSIREAQRRTREKGAYGGDPLGEPHPELTELHVIRCDYSSVSGGLFSAKRYFYDSAANTKTEVETCWVRSLVDVPPPNCYFWGRITGQHTDGLLIFTPVSPLTAPAKITRRTATTCGQSGSGSGSGAGDTLYIYNFVRGKWIYTTDGCFTFDTDFSLGYGTAYEKGNRKVKEGSIVEMEQIFADISHSGSGTGIACTYVFDGSGMEEINTPPPESQITFRYFCMSGQFDEYKHNGDGTYDFVRHTGVLCGCCGSGSGSGGPGSGGSGDSGSGVCCSLGSTLCVCLDLTCCGLGTCCVTLHGGGNIYGGVSDSCNISVSLIVHHNPDGTCDYELGVARAIIGIGCSPVNTCGMFLNGLATSVNCSPLNLGFALTGTQYSTPANCGTTTVASCRGTATVTSGACASEGPGSGSGGGGAGECHWKCTGSIWGWDIAFGTEPACCVTQGPPVGTCTDGATTTTSCGGGGGGSWWCVEAERHGSNNCAGPIQSIFVECVQAAFANVGDTMCVNLGGNLSDMLTALSGPYNSEGECSEHCF